MDSASGIRKFGEFRRSFVEALESRLAEIERAMDAVRLNPGDPFRVADAVRRLEQLFGLGGPLGLSQLCRAASLFRGTVPPDPDVAAEKNDDILQAFLEPRPAPPPAERPRRVFLAAGEPGTSARIVEALRPFSYDVVPFDDLDALKAAMEVERPLAAALGASIAPPAAFLDALRARGVPLFYLSKDGGLEARIAAVRAGARGFFSAEDDAATLAEGLDRLALEPRAEPHRVLIVDDDPVAARVHAAPLRRCGMTVQTVTDPARALDVLLRFHPDILLLDMDLGPFTGDELAAAVRQHPACVGLPIVYLSSEARPAFQFAARGAGAEGFLVKPVPPSRLLAETLLRAERGRAIRTHLLFDGPTGTLHPPAFLRRLRGEVELARRRGRPLCCAEARIDGFAALDEARQGSVPRQFRDLLRARLRGTDVIGRSGPDGVTIALLDVDARAAARILEELRRAFDESERATLSAGAAVFPAVADGGLLLDTARQAQLRAAEAGGNRVVILPSGSVV